MKKNGEIRAKIGVDTAENEPLEVWGKIIQYYSFVSLAVKGATEEEERRPGDGRGGGAGDEWAAMIPIRHFGPPAQLFPSRSLKDADL